MNQVATTTPLVLSEYYKRYSAKMAIKEVKLEKQIGEELSALISDKNKNKSIKQRNRDNKYKKKIQRKTAKMCLRPNRTYV